LAARLLLFCVVPKSNPTKWTPSQPTGPSSAAESPFLKSHPLSLFYLLYLTSPLNLSSFCYLSTHALTEEGRWQVSSLCGFSPSVLLQKPTLAFLLDYYLFTAAIIFFSFALF
jgi:hypothetical protein